MVDELLNNPTVLLALGGLTAALFIWGVVQVVLGLVPGERDQVLRRLMPSEQQGPDPSAASVSILRKHPEFARPQSSFFQKFEHKLRLLQPEASVGQFAMVMLAIAVVFGMAAGYFIGVELAIVAALFGAVVPVVIFNFKYARRQRILGDQLMDGLEFMARALRAGHSLATAIQMVGEELPDPLAAEFRRCHDQHSLGQAMEEALTAMAKRVDLADFNFFVTSVAIQRQTGGDLAEVLDNIGNMVRARIRLHQQVKALTGEGRATGYVLTALPGVVFVAMWILNPKYIGTLVYTETGRWLLAATVFQVLFGLFLIRKIVTIKV